MALITSVDGFGPILRSLRRQAGMTQEIFAAAVGTTQSAVSRWERGHEVPRLSTILDMLRVLGSTLELGDGVDRAQIRQHLAMSPRQRLDAVRNVSRFRASVG